MICAPTPAALLAARRAHGHTQRRAALEVGVEANTWARWERGESQPRGRLVLQALRAYCRAAEKPKSEASQ